MKQIVLIGIVVGLLILGIGVVLTREARVTDPQILTPSTSTTPISSESSPLPTVFTAQFEISTNGTKRIFSDPMYHYQSEEVYLTAENPKIVHLQKDGITWDDFFKTLPFSLSKDCLITGTQQTFCSTPTQKLRFFINEVETPDALDKKIQADDRLEVEFGS